MISRVCRTASRSNIAKFGASFSTAPSTSAEGAGSPAQKVPKFVDILDNKEAAKALSPEEKMKIGLYKAQKNRELTRRTPKPKSLTDYAVGDIEPLPEPAELAVLTGMPDVHQNRTVLIRNRFTSSMQSGGSFAHQWQISWKRSESWTNPLTGYTSGADPMASVKLFFDTKEEAVQYAKRYNWKFEVTDEVSDDVKVPGWRNYGHNFLAKKIAASTVEDKREHFAVSTYGHSHFSMPLKYHGNGEVVQHGGE